ncbi:hypothetical protein FPV67DRAFT_1419045 [Lyophyllum atratum]|nr:hypothetical protein FPV67DRAFT_1419045 [Lyophyllum atratum]
MRPSKLGNLLQNAALRSRPVRAHNRIELPRRANLSLKAAHALPLTTSFRPRTSLRGQAVFPNCHSARYSSQYTRSGDPNHTGLFYHRIDPPTPISRDQPAFALSFLQSPPPHAGSSTIIGWLPATSTGSSSEGREAGLNDFVENPKFRNILHKAIQDGLEKGVDDIQINGALQLQEGWMHIHDDRNIPPLGRIGDPDDIIATVLVRDSKIMPETYQAMPSYRLCTADGLTQLTPGLQTHLQSHLVQEAQAETNGLPA